MTRPTSTLTTHQLIYKRRFLPYFLTQFFGAFNDNIFKNVLLILVAFASQEALPISSNLFINLAAGLFILPFFLFSATAGELADRYDKDWYIRRVKLAEIAIMLFGAIGFITHSYTMLLILLFFMGTQSAFFGPAKYALLPQHLKPKELVAGNALVETGTFLAILLGTLIAGVIATSEQAHTIAAIAVVLFALLGYLSSRSIPKAPATHLRGRVGWQPVRQMRSTLAIAHKNPRIFWAIMAISWFWFLGAAYLTQFPNFTRVHLQGSESGVSFLLALFSVGVAVGSLLYSRLSNSRVEYGIIPLAGIGISLFGWLLSCSVPEGIPQLSSINAFISYPSLWPTFSYLLLLGVSGGLFIVPLYTIIQQQAEPHQRSQVIAANNIYNALFMVASALLAIVSLGVIKLSILELFQLLALLNLIFSGYLLRKLPIYVVRFILWVVSRSLYRVRVHGSTNLPDTGGVLLVCNHVSYLDSLLLSAIYPRLIRFVMEQDYANYRPIRGFLRRAKVIPIAAHDSASIRRAIHQITRALKQGEVVCIFPEGELTPNGEIQPFQRGVELILKHASAPVIPIALTGLWGSYFSRYHGTACKGIPKLTRSKVTVYIGAPIKPALANSSQLHASVMAQYNRRATDSQSQQ